METPTYSAEFRRISRVALGDLVHRAAARHGSSLAVVDGEHRLTHHELDARSSQFAHHLAGLVSPGAHVATLCANSADLLVAIYGINKSGHVWVPVNTQLAAEQIGYILRHAEISAVVVDEELLAHQDLGDLLRELALPLIRTRVSAEGGAGTPLTELVAGQPTSLPEVDIRGEQVALIMYTSGTTGHPKGVMHSHASVHGAIIGNVATHGFTERDVMTGMLPLFHCAQHVLTSSVLAAAGAIVLSRGFSVESALGMISHERATIFGGLPMMYAAVLDDERVASTDMSSLRLALYGMAPMPAQLSRTIADVMGVDVWLITGQTETYPVTMRFQPLEHPHLDANYWGVSTIICDTAVMDEDGRLLAPGEPGEIVHRGPNVMLGYFKDPAATAAAQKYGWHHTGDLGVVNEDGQLLFLDRKKDMIKTGGENVPSVKVEATLLAHPAVSAAAVFGVPHPRWSEAIVAAVVLAPDHASSVEDLTAYCRSQLGGFEVPKAIVFVDALPMTATGKIQKPALREKYADHFASSRLETAVDR